jgi:hypothetical protein
MDPIRTALAVARIVSGVVRATRASSDGGRKVTRAEWEAVLSEALSQVAVVLEESVGDSVER